jgi:hypothetical protein
MGNNGMFLTEKTKDFFKQLRSGITEIENVEFLKNGEAVTVFVDGKTVFEYYFTEEKEFDYTGDDYDYNFGGAVVKHIITEHQNYYFETGDQLICTKRGDEPATRSFVPEDIVLFEDGIDYPINTKTKKSNKVPFRFINGNLCYAGQYSNIFQLVLDKDDNIKFTIDGKTVDIESIIEGKDLINRLINRYYDKKEGSKVDSISSKIEDELSYLETILVELIKKRAKVSSRHDDTKDTCMLRKGIDSLKTDLNYTNIMLSNEESFVVEEACAVLNIIRPAYDYFHYYKAVGEQKNILAIDQFNKDIEKLDTQRKQGNISECRLDNKVVWTRKGTGVLAFYESLGVDFGNWEPKR